MRCLGGCNRQVVVYCQCGGGCVEFPEDTGYCSHCYPTSTVYKHHSRALQQLIDQLEAKGTLILQEFVQEFQEDHRQLYLDTIEEANSSTTKQCIVDSDDSQLSLFDQ
jgi:hypothetical protein